MKPAARRDLASRVRQAYELSEKRACGLIRTTRWTKRYQSRRGAGSGISGAPNNPSFVISANLSRKVTRQQRLQPLNGERRTGSSCPAA